MRRFLSYLFLPFTKCNQSLMFHWFSSEQRANHPFKSCVKSARLDCYKYSFFIRIVSKWNDLPRDLVEAESLHHFKNKIHHYVFNKF